MRVGTCPFLSVISSLFGPDSLRWIRARGGRGMRVGTCPFLSMISSLSAADRFAGFAAEMRREMRAWGPRLFCQESTLYTKFQRWIC